MALEISMSRAEAELQAARSKEDIFRLFEMAFGIPVVNGAEIAAYEVHSEAARRWEAGEEVSQMELVDLLDIRGPLKAVDKEHPGYLDFINENCRTRKEGSTRDALEDAGQKFLRKCDDTWQEPRRGHRARDAGYASHMAWQARADVWGLYRVDGLESFCSIYDREEFAEDREKLADAVVSRMSDASETDKRKARDFVSGRIVGMTTKSKKDALFLERCLELRDQCLDQVEDFSAKFTELRDHMRKQDMRAKALAGELYKSVTDALNEASGISQAEAEQWAAKNVYINKKMESELRGIGYPAEQLRKDIAEFYRYCGGKLGPVEFIGTKKRRRAFAHGRLHISIDCDFNKRTLFHECGHLVEAWDEPSLNASIEFIKGRASGGIKSLNALSPNGYGGYRSDEKAYPDSFVNRYIGKDYQGRASEVYSMGMQMLGDPETFAWFMHKDPEHCNLTIGQCLRKNPVIKARIAEAIEKAATQVEQASDETRRKEEWQKALKKAMPQDFRQALNGHMSRCSLSAITKTKASLYLFDSAKKVEDDAYGKIGDMLAIAYLFLASQDGLLAPDNPYGTGDVVDTAKIKTDILLRDYPPEWFDADSGLPKYELPQEAKASMEAHKKRQDKDDALKRKFMAALDASIPDDLMGRLQSSNGIEGLSVMASFSGSYSLYTKNISNHSGYLGDFTREECLRMAALLCLYGRGLLPENFDRDMAAILKLKKYARGEMVPEWFYGVSSIPELTL